MAHTLLQKNQKRGNLKRPIDMDEEEPFHPERGWKVSREPRDIRA